MSNTKKTIAEKKKDVGFKDETNRMCIYCKHFQCVERTEKGWSGMDCTTISSMKCALHGFPSKKMARCRDWEIK